MAINLNIFDEYVDKILSYIPFDTAFYHPYIVDVAVVLPVVALLFQGSKKADFHKAANVLFFTGIIAIFLAYLSGKATIIQVQNNIGMNGLDMLDKHATQAAYIILSYLILMMLKLMQLATKNENIKKLVTFLMYGAGIVIVLTSISGHELIFSYGAGLGLTR